MSDFESRLGKALSSGAEGAPDASGLAAGARRRARRRRQATLAAAALAVVTVVAVPVGVVALRDDDPRRGDLVADPAPTPTSTTERTGTRIETWRDIQVEVPASWGYGSRAAWCAGSEADVPVVERPGTAAPSIACSPAMSAGLTFGSSATISLAYPSGHVWKYDGGDEYDPGTWLGYWYDEDDLVTVAAPDRSTVEQVVRSVQVVESVDGNGCPVRDDGDLADVSDREVSVCRYSPQGELEQSERLTGAEADAARDAVASASEAGLGSTCDNGETEYVVLTVTGRRAEVQYAGQPCIDRGVFVGGARLELTEDVLYWALSPGWSGGVEAWVPLPDELRTIEAEPAPDVAEPVCPEGSFASSDFALEADKGGAMTVCRMELDRDGESGGSYLLAEEARLTTSESDAVRDALEVAPVLAESDFEDCAAGPGEFFLVLAGGTVVLWVYNGQCGDQAALTRGEDGSGRPVVREVTAELLEALGSRYGLLRQPR